MAALQDDTAIKTDGERFTAILHPDWNIWGPNGGYVSAVALRAAGAVTPPDHRPATLSVQYLSVAEFDEVDCLVTPMKKGRNAWLLNVALVQKGRTFLQAQVWTTNKAVGPTTAEAVMPDVPGPDRLKTLAEHLEPYGETLHGFWTNIDAKPLAWVHWNQPRSAAPAVLREWYRFVGYEPGDAFLDACRAVILIDTLIWPTHHRGLAERPNYVAPSLDLTVWFHEPADEADWLLVDGVADIAGQGLIHGRSRVWTPDGRAVATGGSNMLHVARD
jgi:acyl-CoA thioesterase II